MSWLYDFSRECERLMRLRGWPFRIEYEPVYPRRDYVGHCAVEFSRSEQPDQFNAAVARQNNPRYVASRVLSSQALIFARSSLEGAARQDHEAQCEQTIDLLLSAFNAARTTKWTALANGGRYLTGKEIASLSLPEQWNGVGYVLQFGLGHGVYDLDYAGEALPEGTLTGFDNSTAVTGPGFGDATACGA